MDWVTIAVAILTGIFGGGVVWGATKQTLRHHDERLGKVEKDVHELREDLVPALARLEGKMDVIVTRVIQEDS